MANALQAVAWDGKHGQTRAVLGSPSVFALWATTRQVGLLPLWFAVLLRKGFAETSYAESRSGQARLRTSPRPDPKCPRRLVRSPPHQSHAGGRRMHSCHVFHSLPRNPGGKCERAARGKSHSGCERVFCPGLIVANTRQIDGFACVSLLDPEQNPALSPTKHFHHGLLDRPGPVVGRSHRSAQPATGGSKPNRPCGV